MQHHLATAGWSLPGGAEQVLASWGYLSRPGAELLGPTLFRGASEVISFAGRTDLAGFRCWADRLAICPIRGAVAFAEIGGRTVAVDRAPAMEFRDATELPRFLDHRERMCFVSKVGAVSFRPLGGGTLFRVRTGRECFT